MKQAVYFPLYNIYSDLVKTAIGLKDNRSVEQFFEDVGVKVHEFGKRKCVKCDDLLGVTMNKPVFMTYEAQSDLSRKIDDLE